jgi:Xaa-Pro aminopeptidase
MIDLIVSFSPDCGMRFHCSFTTPRMPGNSPEGYFGVLIRIASRLISTYRKESPFQKQKRSRHMNLRNQVVRCMVFNLSKARELMNEMKLDCLVATSHDNVYYSSGSEIETISSLKRLAAIFIPLDGDPVFAVHANEQVTARETTWIKDLRVYKGGEWEPLKPVEFVADILEEKGLAKARIGLELFDIPALSFKYLRDLLPSAEFVDAQHIFDQMKSVKSSEELKLLSDANMATAKAIVLAFEMARPSDSERNLAQNLMNLIVEYGADRVAFVALAAGPNILELHHVAGDYKIKEGDLVHTDSGGYFKGYQSDLSRTAVVGKPSESQLKAYDIAVRAERATASAMREGAKVSDVYEATRRYYESRGFVYGDAFIGHSIGIGCHELPFLGPSHGNWVLEPGMFFEVEPSITIGQVRVHTEDAFVIRKGLIEAENVSEYRDISQIQTIR